MRPDPLPAGAVLLHIGPYKTGSTSLQAALFAARPGFAAHGVAYPGRWRRAMRPGWSALGWAPRGRELPPPEVWDEFAADIRRHPELRTCVSTEDFGSVGDRAGAIVRSLGDERVHVVTVARRLDRLLPSAWQERVKSHDERGFDEWLREVLDDPESPAHRAFWRSQDIVAQAERWLASVPPERFHVVVTDDSDRTLLFRVFEGLLDLPEGILAPTPTDNASLTANAAELLRRLNGRFAEAGWSDRFYHRAVHQAVIPGMAGAAGAGPSEPIPRLPAWAAERAARLADDTVAGLARLGVRVIGDPGGLRIPTDATGVDGIAAPETISIAEAEGAVAAALEVGLELRKQERRRARQRTRRATGAETDLGSVSGRRLAGELARRGAARLRPRSR